MERILSLEFPRSRTIKFSGKVIFIISLFSYWFFASNTSGCAILLLRAIQSKQHSGELSLLLVVVVQGRGISACAKFIL